MTEERLLQALRQNAEALGRAQGFDAEAELALSRRFGDQIFVHDEPGYPSWLEGIKDAPKLLYVRGTLTDQPGLALVGTRRATPYGLRAARLLAEEAAAANVVTVSGLARGIDTIVHEATINKKGFTWAVLGHGLLRIYPPENRGLAKRIVDLGGALITEYPYSAPPLPEYFPQRNRIISGLCWATGVIEGDFKSGAMITARFAEDQGRDVYAVPGHIDSPQSVGPHNLISKGARPFLRVKDAIDDLVNLSIHRRAMRAAADKRTKDTSENEKKILKLIGSGTAGFDRLAQATSWSAGQLSTILTDLELKSLIAELPGNNYARK